jgi:type IV pilus assembly protein PilO
MPDLRRTRKNLKTALAVMGGVSLLAAVVYISPLVGSAETRRMELNQLQTELTTKTRQVAPLKDLPHKVVIAKGEIDDFYKRRFPSVNSQVYTELGRLAAANGVTIAEVKYKLKDAETARLQQMEIEADFSGNYTALAKFINAVERDEMFFIINSVTLGGNPQGPVRLNVRLETYLKAEP